MRIFWLYSRKRAFKYEHRGRGYSWLRGYLFLTWIIIALLICASIATWGLEERKKVDQDSKNPNGEEFTIQKDDVIFDEKNKEVPKVKLYISKNNTIEELNLEEYVRGVVCAEMQANFEKEALKAQAVAARTYALAHMERFGGERCKDAKGGDLCDTVHCQVYMSKEDRFKGWEKGKREEYWNKISDAVKETSGEVITYNDMLIKSPYYFAISSGRTENAVDVFASNEPYLQSVKSPGEEVAPKYKSSVKFSYGKLAERINIQFPKADVSAKKLKNQISVEERSAAGGVKTVKVGNIKLNGPQLRTALGLNSSDFSFQFKQDEVEIICMGYGHGVGMSQWGANAMAKVGSKCNEIIEHYYQGTKVKKLEEISEFKNK